MSIPKRDPEKTVSSAPAERAIPGDTDATGEELLRDRPGPSDAASTTRRPGRPKGSKSKKGKEPTGLKPDTAWSEQDYDARKQAVDRCVLETVAVYSGLVGFLGGKEAMPRPVEMARLTAAYREMYMAYGVITVPVWVGPLVATGAHVYRISADSAVNRKKYGGILFSKKKDKDGSHASCGNDRERENASREGNSGPLDS